MASDFQEWIARDVKREDLLRKGAGAEGDWGIYNGRFPICKIPMWKGKSP